MAPQDLSGATPERLFTETLAKHFRQGLLVAGVGVFPVFSVCSADDALSFATSASSYDLREGQRVSFGHESASPDARHVANWIVHASDNRQLPFVIVDKTEGKVFVFYADGRLRGAAPALLGLALGDESVPGIGNRKLSSIRPEERTTPAGRFDAFLGRNLRGDQILWLHSRRVITGFHSDASMCLQISLATWCTQLSSSRMALFTCYRKPDPRNRILLRMT